MMARSDIMQWSRLEIDLQCLETLSDDEDDVTTQDFYDNASSEGSEDIDTVDQQQKSQIDTDSFRNAQSPTYHRDERHFYSDTDSDPEPSENTVLDHVVPLYFDSPSHSQSQEEEETNDLDNEQWHVVPDFIESSQADYETDTFSLTPDNNIDDRPDTRRNLNSCTSHLDHVVPHVIDYEE